jgi:hypothetical protein
MPIFAASPGPSSLWTAQSTPHFWWAVLISTLALIGFMTLLHQLPARGKKWLMIGATFLAGCYFVLEYFLPTHPLPGGGEGNIITESTEGVLNFMLLVGVWPLLLGLISLVSVHGLRIVRRQPGWHHSLAFFLALIGMLVAGFWAENPNGAPAPDAVQFLHASLYNGLLLNLDSAMFALLAFYIASAAYRAFRVRTAEAALLMLSALVVMLGVVGVGVAITSAIPADSWMSFFRLEKLSLWLLKWVNMPGQRAVTIGVAVGALAMAMRLWLSLERGAFFSVEG